MSGALPVLHVVAVAARTPVGLLVESSAAAVRAGICRFREHPYMIGGTGEPVLCAMDAQLEATLQGGSRLVALLSAALSELLAKLPRAVWSAAAPLPLLLALPESRPGFGTGDAQAVASAVQAQLLQLGDGLRLEATQSGHAGGLFALATAVQRIQSGAAELCVVGGVDSYLCAQTLDWLQQCRQLTDATVRSGFTPGEGAGLLALASERARQRYGLTSLAVVRGVGTAHEPKRIKSDADNLGEGLSQAVRQATADLRLPEEQIDTVYCDLNGERYRSEEWGFAMLRGQARLRSVGYEAAADCWGDQGAATGPLLCGLAVQSFARRYAAGPLAMLFTGSEAGLRAAAVLKAPFAEGGRSWQA